MRIVVIGTPVPARPRWRAGSPGNSGCRTLNWTPSTGSQGGAIWPGTVPRCSSAASSKRSRRRRGWRMGNYGPVRDQLWRRATHLVWLDYSRRVIMRRVIVRSLRRVVMRTELWAGNRERWRHFVRPSHPIRWAWSTWSQRRRETSERLAQPDYASITVLRLRHPRDAPQALRSLAACAEHARGQKMVASRGRQR